MAPDHRAELAEIKRFDQLVRYLRDRMGWPIDTADFEELTFEYTPEELGIDSKNAAKIQEIKRLRPLAAGQPWGIFFVKFEPKKLPVVALRRILGQVALKKRASANKSERQAWSADDLLFVSNYGEGDQRQISFAHFSTPRDADDLPTLKVLGWDNLDTALHLDEVARELSQHLAWPPDEQDATAWRDQWRAAFTLGHREVVTTSRELSIRLAELARAIRDRIKTSLAIETDRGPLTKLMKAFKEALVHDLDADGFADMYAQTIAYGLLSARISDPRKKTAEDFAAHMRTNPFLRDLMEAFIKVGGRKKRADGPGIDFDELGVSEVVDLLDDANMEAVVRDFGDRNPLEDPVIHFYELFLKEYDAKKRMQRGVFYTPRPVVTFIVQKVDELLRAELGLADGLADTTTWGDMARRRGELKLPKGVNPADPFVQILDPATGTGTFLVEAIDLIHRRMMEKWKAQGHSEKRSGELWNDYVPKHLLGRLYGFELLMAPYAIAHLKIGLKLYETGYRFESAERARVFLTNALEPQHDFSDRLAFDVPALASESNAVAEVKRDRRFSVVIGNPPYNNQSENKTDWIMQLIEPYKVTVRREETQIQALSDDYVKFFRLADWNIGRAGLGVVGMITNNGYLDGHIFRDMRAHIAGFYNAVNIVNLHGDARKKEQAPDGGPDKNVFDIMQGVSIVLATGTGQTVRGPLLYVDLWGDRPSKSARLAAGLRGEPWVEIGRADASKMLMPGRAASAEWGAALPLAECFGTGNWAVDKTSAYGSGFKSQQDEFALAFTREELVKNVETLLAPGMTEEGLRSRFSLCNTSQWDFGRARERLGKMQWRNRIQRVLFRPFDIRFSIVTADIITNPRREIMAHLERPNIALLATRKSTEGFAVFASRLPCGHKIVGNYDMTTVFPLYRYLDSEAGRLALDLEQKQLNFSPAFLRSLGAAVGKRATRASVDGVQPEEILNYVYAVLHSPTYRRVNAEHLKVDFPRVPLPGGLGLFRALAAVGEKLISWHVLDVDKPKAGVASPVGSAVPLVGKVSHSKGSVWLNESKTIGFQGVSAEAWEFHIGSYRVCEKWLKDRKDRVLSKAEMSHYQLMVSAIEETLRLTREVDRVVDMYGGWPAAFQGEGTSGAVPVPVAAERGALEE